MENAIAEVDQGGSVRRAAEKFGARHSTLHDHVSGKVEQHARQGPIPYLTPEEEEELANFYYAVLGYIPYTASFINDRKTLTEGEIPGAAYGLSTKGWMDGWRIFLKIGSLGIS